MSILAGTPEDRVCHDEHMCVLMKPHIKSFSTQVRQQYLKYNYTKCQLKIRIVF